MSGRAVGVAWLRREDYQRIREISDDEMVPTFDEFEAKMTRQLSNLEAAGMVCKKVIIDPDELLAYARRVHGGKINSKVRAGLAGFLVMKKTRRRTTKRSAPAAASKPAGVAAQEKTLAH